MLRLPDYLCVDLNSPQNRFRIDTELDGEQSRELEQVPCFWGMEKFDLNLRSHFEICHSKQAHADIAEIDTKTIQLDRPGEYLYGCVRQERCEENADS